MRGFKKDLPATKAAQFLDKRSFISLPKIINGESFQPKPHVIAYGKDIAPIRAEIFRLDRLKNGGVNRCWKCGGKVIENVEEELMLGWSPPNNARGEWDHVRNKPGTRCDDIENARVSCHSCHSERHLRPQFSQHKELA